MAGPTYYLGMTQTKQPNAREEKGHSRDNVGILKSRDDFSPSPAKKQEKSPGKAGGRKNDGGNEKEHER